MRESEPFISDGFPLFSSVETFRFYGWVVSKLGARKMGCFLLMYVDIKNTAKIQELSNLLTFPAKKCLVVPINHTREPNCLVA